jgi:hypothetical protein
VEDDSIYPSDNLSVKATVPQLKRSDDAYLTPGASEGELSSQSGGGDCGTGTGIELPFNEGLKIARLVGVLEEVLPVLRKFAPLLEKVRSEDDENYYRMCPCGYAEYVPVPRRYCRDIEEAVCSYCGDRDCNNECKEVYCCSTCGRSDCGAVMDGGFPGDESCINSC